MPCWHGCSSILISQGRTRSSVGLCQDMIQHCLTWQNSMATILAAREVANTRFLTRFSMMVIIFCTCPTIGSGWHRKTEVAAKIHGWPTMIIVTVRTSTPQAKMFTKTFSFGHQSGVMWKEVTAKWWYFPKTGFLMMHKKVANSQWPLASLCFGQILRAC